MSTGSVQFADPAEVGGRLVLRNPITGEEAVLDLPGQGWKSLGKTDDAATIAWRYKDPGGGPCKKVLVRPGKKFVARCKGAAIGFTLDEATQGTLTVELHLGDAPAQCATFGGDILRDQGTPSGARALFKARDAPPGEGCAAPAS